MIIGTTLLCIGVILTAPSNVTKFLTLTGNPNIMRSTDFDRSMIRAQFNKMSNQELTRFYAPWTMVNSHHQDFANRAIKRINNNQTWVDGDIVECGVWKGGMTMAVVFENMKTNIDRHFWLFDTFEGMPEPSDRKDDPKAKKIYNDLVLKFGLVKRIHSDQGKEFDNTLFKRLHQLAGTDCSRTTPYHPQGNGLTERFNRSLIGMLKS